MYRIVYLESDSHDSLYASRKTIWCYGRECSTIACQSLYHSPYIVSIILYDADDNIVETWGVV